VRTRLPGLLPAPPPGPAPRSAGWPAGSAVVTRKKAAVAVAHTLICIAWAVIDGGSDYAEAGEQYYEQRDQRNREHLVRHYQQALARLGYQVTLVPPGDGSPPPGTDTPPTAAPGQGGLTLNACHRRAHEPASAALPRAWLGSPSFVTVSSQGVINKG
jgi:hypothetical protein